MNILSLQESDSMAREANFLCYAIESRQEGFRKGDLGKKIAIDNAIFCVVQSDRNIVYRIWKDYNWYLKMPQDGDAKPILREIVGAENITNSLANENGYLHPAVVRGSTDSAYVLYSEIPGNKLNIAFYSGCFLPFLGRSEGLKIGFSNFGKALGILHQTKSSAKDPVATRDLVSEVRRTFKEIVNPDPTVELIDSFLSSNNIASAPRTTFIHGNLKMENILFGSNKICFIDFENCGYGSPYEDLSWPASQIILTRTVFGFPWKPAYQTLSRFLEGYRSNFGYKKEQLIQYITLRISLYYLQILLGKLKKPKIAGLPIRIPGLQKMVSELVSGNFESFLPEISV